MEMAREPPDLTGKMGGLAIGSECDLCGATKPIKYCAECNVKLCPTCTKGHGVLPTTKDHTLLDVAMLSSASFYARSGDAESGPSPCAKHNLEFLELYCKECKLMICRECHKDHNGHSIKALKDDMKMFQAICTEHIKSLLDKSHDLEGGKVLIDGIFESYDEAVELVKRWEKELIKLIEECSMSLRDDLKKTKNNWENLINDTDHGLDKTVTDVENGISKLHSMRKVSDTDLFSHELAASQQLLERVNQFLKNVLPTLTVPTVGEILPNMSKLPMIKTGIRNLMETPQRTSNKVSASVISLNIDSPIQISEANIQDPNCEHGYWVCESPPGDKSMIIFGSGRGDVRFMNITNDSINTQDRHESQCNIWDMFSTGLGEFVAMGYKQLHLLNSKFEMLETRVMECECKGLAFLDTNRFVLLEVEEKSGRPKYFAKVSIVNINHGQFHVKHTKSIGIEHTRLHMKADTSGKYVYIFGNEHLYKVHIEDGTTQHKNMFPWNMAIWSLCLVGENILLGCGLGKVHLLDKNLVYKKVVLQFSSPVAGIAVVNDKMVITTKDPKIYLYK